MTEPFAPNNPATGKGTRPPLDYRSLRDRLEGLHVRIRRLEANRTPRPLGVHDLSNAVPMSQALPGHAPVNDANTGQYVPSPVLATRCFNLIGKLLLGSSPPHWSRYDTWIVGLSASVGTFLPDVDFALKVNGTTIKSVSMVASDVTGHVKIDPPVKILAYVDLLTIDVTAFGAGSKDLFVQVELGSFVGQNPAPTPLGS